MKMKKTTTIRGEDGRRTVIISGGEGGLMDKNKSSISGRVEP